LGNKIIYLFIFACSLLSVSCKKKSQDIPSTTPEISVLKAVISVSGNSKRGFRSTDSILIIKRVDTYQLRKSDTVIIVRAADPVGVITLNLVNISSTGTYFFKSGDHFRDSFCDYFELAPASDYPVNFSTSRTEDPGNLITGTFTINKINAIEIEGTFSATMGYLDGINAKIEDGAFKGKFIN
jgi:hypothetical protein